jgi:hypothetical protein
LQKLTIFIWQERERGQKRKVKSGTKSLAELQRKSYPAREKREGEER